MAVNRKSLKRFGERGRNRTYNLLIKSQLLCQLSYAPAELLSECEAEPFAAYSAKSAASCLIQILCVGLSKFSISAISPGNALACATLVAFAKVQVLR